MNRLQLVMDHTQIQDPLIQYIPINIKCYRLSNINTKHVIFIPNSPELLTNNFECTCNYASKTNEAAKYKHYRYCDAVK